MRFLCVTLLALLLLLQTALAAPIVDAKMAEAAFLKGDYKAARSEFDGALEQFLAKAPRDGLEHNVYAEAEYLLDRLADCSFTQRDWARLKQYTDSQWRMINQDIAVCEQQLRGTVASVTATRATAQYVADKLDESLRLRLIFQLKRSLALILLDSNGSGPEAEKAIKLYQQLALLMRKVLSVEDGAFLLDVRQLGELVDDFEQIHAALPEREMKPLWEKYKPPADNAKPKAAPKTPAKAQPKSPAN